MCIRDRDHGVQAVEGRLHRPQPGLLGRAVGGPDGDGDRPHHAAVPLRREEGHVLSDARTTTTTVLDRTAVAPRPRPLITAGTAEAERPRRRIDWNAIHVHAALLMAVALVAFPLYYAFVISTQAIDEVIQKPPRLLPSSHLVENYVEAWRRSGMARLLLNSAIVAVGVAVGKIAISMLS